MKTATWSFDDGGPDDLRVMDILRAHGVTATFYLVAARVELTMNPRAYDGFEVASHTLTHPIMRNLTPAGRAAEIMESRAWFAGWLGEAPHGIAWPGGGYVPDCGDAARAAGYRYGRGYFVSPSDPHTFGAPWNRGISVKFAEQPVLIGAGCADLHLVAHPAAMNLALFEETLRLMLDLGYRFVPNAEFYHVV